MICTRCGEEFTPTSYDMELEDQGMDPCCQYCRTNAYQDILEWGE